jgi:TIR domain
MSRQFAAKMSGGIFISYRRDDASFLAGRLYERLLEHFPWDKIFMDLDRVAHSEELIKTIEKAIESSDVLIALIGRRWLSSDLGSPNDYVRLELAAAFKRNVRVIPVLVDGASMPRNEELRDDLKALAHLEAGK